MRMIHPFQVPYRSTIPCSLYIFFDPSLRDGKPSKENKKKETSAYPFAQFVPLPLPRGPNRVWSLCHMPHMVTKEKEGEGESRSFDIFG